jgi:hypothetical protein
VQAGQRGEGAAATWSFRPKEAASSPPANVERPAHATAASPGPGAPSSPVFAMPRLAFSAPAPGRSVLARRQACP